MTASEFDDFSDDVPCQEGETVSGMRRRLNALAGDVLGTLWIGGLAGVAAVVGLAGRWRRTTASVSTPAA